MVSVSRRGRRAKGDRTSSKHIRHGGVILGLACDDDPFGAQGGPGGDRRRRPGHARHPGHEGRRGQDPQAAGRPGAGRVRRLGGRRVRTARAVRGEAEGLPEQRAAGRDRAGQALADRPDAAAAGGGAGRGRFPAQPALDRLGRRDPAQRRHPGDRLGRRLRPGGRAGAGQALRSLVGRDRPRVAGDRRRYRHLYQFEPDGGGTAVPEHRART